MEIKKGTTSRLQEIFLSDSSSTTGAGKTGLTYSDITGYYIRPGDTSPTQITMVDGTVGTYSSGGIAEIDGTNMPGAYELGIPDACLAAGSSQCLIMLTGSGFAPLPMRIDLVDNTSKDVYDSIVTTGRSEPSQGAPPVSPALATKIDYLYEFLRNKVITTTSHINVYANDGTTINHKSPISDDGTAFTRGEFISG